MVIGERFAWGHLEKTGGDATVEFFLAVPELIRFADPPSSEEKHTLFSSRAAETRGKVLALNIRRLPGWMLSRALHRARYGAYPDFKPLPMASPQQMAESSDADRELAAFTDDGRIEIDRWLRTEFLAADFLAFISEFTAVPESKRGEILELASSHRGTPLVYDHEVDHWFSHDQLRRMYENNPVWAAFEQRLYGPNELPAASRTEGIEPGMAAETAEAAGNASGTAPGAANRKAGPLTKRELLARRAEQALEERSRQSDPREAELSELDRASQDRQIALLATRRYRDVLELGCDAGLFTGRLAGIADRVLALDAAPMAIAQARTRGLDPGAVEFRLANMMDFDMRAEGPWDLVVMSETIYDFGWLYPLFDIGWLASELFAATRDGGRFLMANTYGAEREYLLSPWLIDTYRDLIVNVGYRLETEEVVRGSKDGVEYEILITVFSKPE